MEEISEAALEKATKKAIREAEEKNEREEEARLAAIDWSAPTSRQTTGTRSPNTCATSSRKTRGHRSAARAGR